MTYRSSRDAAENRRATLAAELAAVRAQMRDIDSLREREAELTSELAAAKRIADAAAGKRRGLPLLGSIQIAAPCSADWNDMVGDERVRFCGGCAKRVYNISAMGADEAEAFLEKQVGQGACVRLYRRADSTVMTADCAVGARKKRVRRAVAGAVGGGFLAAIAVVEIAGATEPVSDEIEHAVMGEMMVVPTPTPSSQPAPPVPPAPDRTGRATMGKPSVSPVRK